MPKSPPAPRADAETLARLRAFIQAQPGPFLPPMARLAKAFRMDIHRLSSALHHLRRKRVLGFRAGQRMRILNRDPDPISLQMPLPSAAEALRRELASRLERGLYPAGTALPKRAYFAADWGLSPRGVGRLYDELARAGYAHRAGRGWRAGPAPGPAAGPRPFRCLLLVEPKPGAWAGLDNERTGRFVHAFEEEAERHQVRLHFWSPRGSAGRGLERELAALGPAYGGALWLGAGETPALLARLERGGRRALRFDTRAADLPPPRPGARYCRFSEAAVADTAVDHLARLGHRGLAYIAYYDPGAFGRCPEWVWERQRALREALRRRKGMTLLGFHEALGQWLDLGPAAFRARLAALRLSPRPRCRKAWRFLQAWAGDGRGKVDPDRTADRLRQALHAWTGPGHPVPARLHGALELLPALADGGASAWILANDAMGRKAWEVLGKMGIRPPSELSLLSIDNYRGAGRFPGSAVDIGAGDLGYRAFHILLGDLPAPPGPDAGDPIIARPTVVQRGSTGPAEAA